jgi:PQ loop repeat
VITPGDRGYDKGASVIEPAMLTTTEIAGFVGAGLAGAAYIPQISHLISARCSAGISRLAFEIWLLASLLITARAIAIHAGVFIVLGGIQIVATTLIMIFATRYKNTLCPIHHPRQPGAKTTRGIPGPAGRVSRERRWLRRQCPPADSP